MEGQRTKDSIKALHKKALQLRIEGYSNKEIANLTGYSKSTISVIFKRAGLAQQKKSLSNAEKEKILKLWAGGKTIQKIAEEIGFSMAAVQKCIKKSKEAEDLPPEIPPVQERKPEVKTIYIKGKRYKDITAFFMG